MSTKQALRNLNYFLLIGISLYFASFAQGAIEWQVTITASGDLLNPTSTSVDFGYAPDSEDIIDSYDRGAAPVFPGQTIRLYFEAQTSSGFPVELQKDIRPSGTWTLNVMALGAFTLTWPDASDIPVELTLKAKDKDPIDMRKKTSVSFDKLYVDTIEITAGITPPKPAASVTVSASPTSLPADGVSTSIITATVKDADGNLVTTETVTMEVTEGNGAIGAVTNVGNGTYTATYTAGTTAGTVTITATTSNGKSGSVNITLVDVDRAATTVEITFPADGAEYPVGATVDVVAEVRDQFELPMAGVEVTFEATGGTVEPVVAPTDATGQAKTQLTVAEGQNIITATITTAEGDKTDIVTVNGTPGVPAVLVKVSGDGQIGVVGQPLANPFVVKVTDQYGNGVVDEIVTFTVTAGGGTLTPADGIVQTDENGEASAIFTLGPTPGEDNNVVEANGKKADGADLDGSPVTFTASATTEPVNLVKAVVLKSAGSDFPFFWEHLNNNWSDYGATEIIIDYSSLNKEGITYNEIVETQAQVLIIDDARNPQRDQRFSPAEVSAIIQYIEEGHGLIITGGTFRPWEHRPFLPLLGFSQSAGGQVYYGAVQPDTIDIIVPDHPLFNRLPTYSTASKTFYSGSDWDGDGNRGYLAIGKQF